MINWTDLGLPSPESNGFGYTVAAGLQRTNFETAHPRQVRRNTRNIKRFTLTFLLTTEQLRIAEVFVNLNGYSWFEIPLDPGGGSHLIVRTMGDYKVSGRGMGLHAIDLIVETQ